MKTVADVSSVNELKVWAYGVNHGAGQSAVYVNVFLGVQWQARVALPFTSSNGWQSATFAAAWGQADFSALKLRIGSVAGAMVIPPASVFAVQAVATYKGGLAVGVAL